MPRFCPILRLNLLCRLRPGTVDKPQIIRDLPGGHKLFPKVFHFHPLAIEDCTTPNSLPKVEDYEEYLFLVIHGVDYTRTDKFSTTELDIFLGRDFLDEPALE